MLSSYQVTFIEKYETGSSLLAVSLMNDSFANHCMAKAVTLYASDIAYSPMLFLAKKHLINIADITDTKIKSIPSYSLLTADNMEDFAKTDMLIGLCFGQADNGNLEEMVKRLGIEQKVALVAYWDLAHLYSDNSERFVTGVFEELQRRVRLLVGA